LLVLLPNLVFSWRRYGTLLAVQETMLNREKGTTTWDLVHLAAGVNWVAWVAKMWSSWTTWLGGWSFVPLNGWLRHAMWACAAIGGVGAAILVSRAVRSSRVPLEPWTLSRAWIVWLAFTALLAAQTIEALASLGEAMSPMWYGAAALPFHVLLLVAAFHAWPGRYSGPGLSLALLCVYLATEVDGVLSGMVKTYSGLAAGAGGFERIAQLQPRLLGTPTFVAAGIAALAVAAWAAGWIAAAIRGAGVPERAR
jgi:hypothetical protein